MKFYNINSSRPLVSMIGYNVARLSVILSKFRNFAESNNLIDVRIIDKDNLIIRKYNFHKKGLIAEMCEGKAFLDKNSSILTTPELIQLLDSL
jgi:hypothetical protein